ncbi:hypothetical protein CK623_09810 [Vandammella animalimorsus]|uniref:Uncharacterized protein n=1 Tax=Vandammella animalimorsus TaxID=2029117 RepID=A0A2A2AP29_9BURK|nr:hypothetical protein [Vandammella animalimorsus]PAT39517.1 hypothetical protein CK623_09810 [Vandammella animalimorsus]RRD64299.1 hypothetical protein EII19_13285 [Comamonadaceae bacterium OH2310_COT-174]
MQREVNVVLAAGQEFRLPAHQELSPQEARQWLDAQFVELDCEPMRASGKVLIADKVLAIAATAGASLLRDPAWSERFAAAAIAALGKPAIKVDIPAMSVNF